MIDLKKLNNIRHLGFFDKRKQQELPLEIEPTAENAWRVFRAAMNGKQSPELILEVVNALREMTAGSLDLIDYSEEDWAKFINYIRNY